MLCLLNAETYKLKKSKSFYVCMAVTVAFILFMFSTIFLMDKIQKEKIADPSGSFSVSIKNNEPNSSGSLWDSLHIMDMLQEAFSGDSIGCILCIFISIFVIREYSSGMMKNIAGKGCSRSSIYLSKLFASILATILIAVTGIAATLICGWIFMGAQAFDRNFWKNLPVYIILQMIMITSLSSLFVFIGELSRNLAAGIAIGICIISFPALLLNVIDMQFADHAFTPSQYWPVTRIASCPFEGFTTGYWIETLLVAAFWIILTTAAGIWHFNKTDIR
ncbi:MAG: ABC transporter permease [Eubacterium sp.]|nr:ABC transporter permease [Eubacterium sp.]